MKKREKKSIIIGFVLAISLFLIFMLIILIYIIPYNKEISEKKDFFNNTLIKEYENIKNKFVDFNNFKKLLEENKNKLTNNEYKILTSIDKNFYDKILFEGKNYNNFTSKGDFKSLLKQELQKKKNIVESDEFVNNKDNIGKILPKYSIYSDLEDKNSLTDFKFINKIENLLANFNIKTKSSIGIQKLSPIGEKSDIYYIPLKLDIRTYKINLLKFIKFIRKNGNIYTNQDGELEFEKLNGEITQLAEIKDLKLESYINNNKDLQRIPGENLEEFLEKTNQDKDIIRGNITINFYVQGISKDKIIKSINEIIGNNKTKIILKKDEEGNFKEERIFVNYNYNNLKTIINKLLKLTEINNNNLYKKKLKEFSLYLNSKSLTNDIKNIKKEMKKSKNLDGIYKKVLKYKEIFKSIDNKIYNLSTNLELTKKIYPKNYYPNMNPDYEL